MDIEKGFKVLKSLCEKYRNWGKWGPEDQLGTVNYITSEKIVQAARLVRQGKVISLSLPFDRDGPQTGATRRFNPIHFMLRDGGDTLSERVMSGRASSGAADDAFLIATHGGTHWDALAHSFWEGKMWNGYDATLVTSAGAEKNGIEHYRDRVVSRGVLLDIPRTKDLPWLDIGYAITSEDLEVATRLAGVEVGRGDVVLVRTGHVAYCRSKGSWGTYVGGDTPGLSAWTAEWLSTREVAAVASDTFCIEVRPNQIKWGRHQPWHKVALPNMGLLLGEMFDLEGLGDDCAADGVYEFLLVAPPLPLSGGVGSPVNPLAIK